METRSSWGGFKGVLFEKVKLSRVIARNRRHREMFVRLRLVDLGSPGQRVLRDAEHPRGSKGPLWAVKYRESLSRKWSEGGREYEKVNLWPVLTLPCAPACGPRKRGPWVRWSVGFIPYSLKPKAPPVLCLFTQYFAFGKATGFRLHRQLSVFSDS